MKIIIYNSISEFHKQNSFPPPENPLFSVIHTKLKEGETSNCEDEELSEPVSLTSRFYGISLKNIISGEILYGRTKYDCTNGTLLFTAPDQTMVFKGMAFSSEAFHIAFHKDFISGTPLFDKIKKYNFFNYHVNEALHLTPKEEQIIKDVFKNIEKEKCKKGGRQKERGEEFHVFRIGPMSLRSKCASRALRADPRHVLVTTRIRISSSKREAY